MAFQDLNVKEFHALCTAPAQHAREAAEHVHDGFGGDGAGCGPIEIAHMGDVEVFQGGVLVCRDDIWG